ncbi:MAG TPA: T9SS type A sorting domain-containing protein, partial [Flavobacteriales bacterium]|nr:T9SS type A sorting domain-containing protein [Flavobacteriales bacterium]
GGGGCERNYSSARNGGDGANGRVILTYTPCSGPTVSVTPTTPTICSGGSVVLTASGATGGYTWSPNIGLSATSGAMVTANPGTTTTYTVTGTNTGCSIPGSTTVTVTVSQGPTGVSANTSSTTICAGSTVDLTGSFAALPTTVFSEDFNGGLGSWSATNTSSGGTPAAAAWTSRPNNYFYNGYGSPDPTFSSNDASPFVLSNSDAQGSGTTATTLVSPGFSTLGYSSLSLSYYHYYRYNASESANVDISTDGTNWTTEQTHTSTQGADDGFVQATIDLSAYTGQPQLFIRFRYEASWDWWWAIDNVTVTGTPAPTTFSWTSTPAGFTSTDQNPTNVTVNANTTFHFTATRSGCGSTASTALVTAVPLPDAGINGTLSVCSSDAPASLLAALGGTPDGGGSWSGPSAVSGGLYAPGTMDPGMYTYTVSAAPCANSTATVIVTEQAATAWYADLDGDGFGDPNAMVMACSQPTDHVVDNSDCDDSQLLYVDGDGDGFGTGSPVACGVADNTDCNDAETHYADTDGDGYGAGAPVACGVTNNTDDCPTVPGLIGSNCDAQPGPGFVLGQLNGSCSCEAIACTENVVIDLRSDANSEQIGWEILDQNSDLVLCSGGAPDEPYPHNITSPITPTCCLPVGCYRLRVTDAGGDGFVSGGITGGYQLREAGANGARIIDNFGNFTSGSVSGLSASMDNGAFCLPTGTDKLLFSSCDKLDWIDNKMIVCHANPAVSAQYGVTNATSGYEFWFFDPNGSYSFRRFRSHATTDGFGHGATRACHFKVNGWYNSLGSPHIPSDMLLNVRVRGRVAGNNLPFGPACQFRIDAALAQCPHAKLQDDPANPDDYSCGVMRNFGGPSTPANRIYANPPQPIPVVASNMVRYQFRFRIVAENICIVRPPQTSPRMVLNWTNGPALECTKTYDVDVRVSLDGGATWCFGPAGAGQAAACADTEDWGKMCKVTINPCASVGGGGSSMALSADGQFTIYPNPNNGENLRVDLEQVAAGVELITLDIFDMTGKRVVARTITPADGRVNSTIELDRGLQSGMYIVHVTAGEAAYTERLVIQH